MILVYVLLASIVLGYAFKGRLSNYLHAPLRGIALPALSFAIEAFMPVFERLVSWPASSWLWLFVSAKYALAFAFVWLNRERKPAWLLGVGTALNAWVIAFNGFRMPVSPIVYRYEVFQSFVERILSGDLFEYVLVDWDGAFWWLGDTIPVLIGSPGIASIGDCILAVGIGWLMIQLMLQKTKGDAVVENRLDKKPPHAL